LFDLVSKLFNKNWYKIKIKIFKIFKGYKNEFKVN
jgi:hypothetical protein